MRHSTIRQVPYIDSGSSGPDIVYVVDLYEDDTKVETQEFPNKSIYYVESVARNWDSGVLDFEDKA